MTDAEKAELERQKEKAANEKRISDLENALTTSQKRALASEITSIFAKAGLSEATYASAIEAFSLMPIESKPEEIAKSFVNGISTENKTALDTAKAAWREKSSKKRRIRVAKLAVAKRKKRVKQKNISKNTYLPKKQKVKQSEQMPRLIIYKKRRLNYGFYENRAV